METRSFKSNSIAFGRKIRCSSENRFLVQKIYPFASFHGQDPQVLEKLFAKKKYTEGLWDQKKA
jgi:hypothetical protein